MAPKTTVIVTHLPKLFFAHTTRTLLPAEELKVAVLALGVTDQLQHYGDLPLLARIVMVFRDEKSAATVAEWLTSHSQEFVATAGAGFRVLLQESMLQRLRLEGSGELVAPPLPVLPQGLEGYTEPEPAKFDNERAWERLQLSPSTGPQLMDLEYLVTANKPQSGKRTQTLFAPLKLDTSVGASSREETPLSPVITLEES